MTSSIASMARSSPRRMCARSWARPSRYRVRRTMTSIWCVDPVPDHLVQPQRPRHPVDQGEYVSAERLLQLGVLVQVVQHDLGDGVALEHEHQPLPGPRAALVADVRDTADPAIAHQLRDLGGEVLRVDLVRQLGDDQVRAAARVFLDLDDRAHGDRAAPGPVGVLDPAVPDDQAAGGKVGALDPLDQRFQQIFVGGLEVVEVPLRAGGDLAQVVRRDLGGHADRDALRAVDQQVGESARQDPGLLGPAVVVLPEIDGVLVDVAQHLHGERGQAALGVAVGSGGVVARRAEVALAVDQRHPHRPRLRQPHQRVIDRRVAVRVVLAHDVADDPGALEEAAVGPVAAVVHRVQDPDVHRLEAVPDVGQRAADDDRHRVVDVAALHLDLDVDRLGPVTSARRRGARVHVRHS